MTGTLSIGGVDAAVLDTERYWWHLAALRESRSRAEAARHVRFMAAFAAHRWAGLAGVPVAVAGGDRDPAAWSGLSDCLRSLAMALEGDFAWPGPRRPCACACDCEVRGAWERLSAAVTRSEFTAAWLPVWQDIERLTAPRADGTPGPLSGFTAAQVALAASAVTAAPW